MRKISVLLALFIVIAAVPLLADPVCTPVNGHFEASVVPPGEGHCPPFAGTLCTAGRVWGGIQGNYQFVATGFFPSAAIGGVPSVLFFTGKSTIFLKNDDQLFGTDTGSIDLPALGGLGGFASLITFTGGTGATSTAKGQIRLRGEFNPTVGTTSGDYLGTLCSQ
jgi:hypothetical protein